MLGFEGIWAGHVVDSWAAVAISIGLGTLCTLTGIQLLERHHSARWVGVGIWLAQIPIVYIGSFGYQIYCGGKLPLILWLPELDLRVGMQLGAGVVLANPVSSGSFAFGINILALVIAIKLWPRRRSSRSPDAERAH